MAQVENIESLRAKLRALSRARDEKVTVLVGFTQSYAVFVHENLEAHHPVGQAKFLETPARILAPQLGNIVRDAVQGGNTLEQGLLLAGLRLQREAQLLTPVDTGALRASAFTRKED